MTVDRVDQNVKSRQKVQQFERQRLAPAEEGCLAGESEGLLGREGIKLMIKGLPGPGPSQVEMLLRRD